MWPHQLVQKTTGWPVALVAPNLSIINILISLLGPTMIICTHLSYFPKNKKRAAWHYRPMPSHRNMEPGAVLTLGLMIDHFWHVVKLVDLKDEVTYSIGLVGAQ